MTMLSLDILPSTSVLITTPSEVVVSRANIIATTYTAYLSFDIRSLVIRVLRDSPDIYILVYTILLRKFRFHKTYLFLFLGKLPHNR